MISRENLAFISATFVAVVLLFTIGLSRPDWLVEDGLVETMGAMGFAAAALLALGAALRKSAVLTLTERSLLVGTSGLSLLLFLSEISFGARIFDIQMPQMSGGGEFDGGHDIVMVLFRRIDTAADYILSSGDIEADAEGGFFISRLIVSLLKPGYYVDEAAVRTPCDPAAKADKSKPNRGAGWGQDFGVVGSVAAD